VLSAQLDRMAALKTKGLPLIEQLINQAKCRTLQVIELGSGCGIVGISLAQTIPDCEVILTDLPEAREIAQRNIENMSPAESSTAIFRPLNWEESLPTDITEKIFDLVLVADCTYNPDSSPALVNTFCKLIRWSPKAVILLAMKVRHQDELIFFDLMKKADFLEASKISVPLPEISWEPEHVDIYVFRHNNRPHCA
jgi:predicted nicotinamide N-methyase